MKHTGKCQLPRTPHINKDIIHHYNTFLRRIFVSNVSAGVLTSGRKIISIPDFINLDNRSIQIIGKGVSHQGNLINYFHYFGCCFASSVEHHRDLFICQKLKPCAMTGGKLLRTLLYVKYKHFQSALSGNLSIKLSQSTGSKISWIRR